MASLPIPSEYTLPEIPTVACIDPSVAVIEAFRVAAAQVVAEAVGLDIEKVIVGVDVGRKNSDFHVALPRFRLGGKPDAWAKKVVDHFKPSQYLSACTSTGGFITFTLNWPVYSYHILRQVRQLSPQIESSKMNLEGSKTDLSPLDSKISGAVGYGCNKSGNGKHAIVEFSSPNIAKPFHAGHLRSTIIGAFLGNLYEANGWKVTRINYLGDWGKQFGLLAVGFKRYGSEEELETNAVKHLFDVYVRINAEAAEDEGIHDEARAYFKLMEDGDKEALALWQRFRDSSIVKLKATYASLNIHYDVYAGESLVTKESMDSAMKTLEEKGLLAQDKGATFADLEAHKLGKVVVRKADGTSIYITRDLGEAAERYKKYKFDKMIYVVAAQQNYHCAQFFKMLDLMGNEWAKNLQHINFGMVLGMSTRKGTVKFLDDILDEAKESMHEQMQKNEAKYAAIEDPELTSYVIGVTAVKIQDFSAQRIKDYKFDPARMTSFEGDTGPYIQYSHVRLCSIERKNPDVRLPEDINQIKTELLTEDKAKEILYLLGTYPSVVRDAFEIAEASTVVTFCYKLTHAISGAWEILKVQGAENDLAVARLYLYLCARDVLASAMRLLTLTPLDRM